MSDGAHDRGFGPEVELDRPAYIHPTALVYGRVRIGEGASLWPHAVVRAELHAVTIGPFANLQDFAMVHVGSATGTHIGAHCSIAHRACVHGAWIGDNCLVGIGATLMDGAVLGENSIVAGHAIVTQNQTIPPNSVVAGVPGRVVASRNNWVATHLNALLYHRNAEAYARGDHRIWSAEAGGDRWMAQQRERLEAAFRAGAGGGGGPGSASGI